MNLLTYFLIIIFIILIFFLILISLFQITKYTNFNYHNDFGKFSLENPLLIFLLQLKVDLFLRQLLSNFHQIVLQNNYTTYN